MTRRYSQKGFTLIELLIVIVIIGILAGVLIAVINPAQQQNRARDAGVKATLNKVALATEGYVSAYGSVPDEIQFMANLSNATPNGTTCTTAATADCMFNVTGNALASGTLTAGFGCGAGVSAWTGLGTSGPCFYRYFAASTTGATFTLYARSFGIINTVFSYTNTGTAAGQIQHCDATATGVGTCTTP